MRTGTAIVVGHPPARVELVRGALLLTLGVAEVALILLAFRIPNLTVTVLVAVMTAMVAGDAAVVFGEAARSPERWAWLVSQALAGAVAGALLLFVPAAWALPTLAWWAIVTAVLEASAWRTPDAGDVILATLGLLVGIFILVGPVHDAALRLLSVAGYGVVAGVVRLREARTGHYR